MSDDIDDKPLTLREKIGVVLISTVAISACVCGILYYLRALILTLRGI